MPDYGRLVRLAIQPLALGLIFALSAATLARLLGWPKLLLRRSGAGSHSLHYEDQDGAASEESTKAYSDLGPRLAAWASVTVGLSSSIASVILSQHPHSWTAAVKPDSPLSVVVPWLDVIGWALVCLQCAVLPLKGQYHLKFRLVTLALLSSLLMSVSIGARYGYGAIRDLVDGTGARLVAAAYLAQIAAALGAVCALGAFPRRPDVFDQGGLVDQQYTVSLLYRLSFSWNQIVFDISKHRQLNLADIPKLGYTTRSRTLHAKFLARTTKGRLWWRLMRAHARELAVQWLLTFFVAFLALFPQVVLYNFLDRIESRRDYSATDPALIVWIFALFLSIVFRVGVNAWLSWITESRLAVPVTSMLQSLVFRKALDQYDTAPPPKKDDEDRDQEPVKSGKKGKGKGDKGVKGDIRQSVINHMKLDSNRVSIFCSFNNNFPLAIFKLVLAGTFLVRLLGWKSFAAGLGSAALIVPLSTWMSKKYGEIQFSLMRYRDGKANLLEEALQGMRQIRYSALEQHWEDKILKSRNEELAQYWKVSIMMCLLIFVITMGPLLLACVSFSVYAWENGSHIRASVIFTSLGLFNQVDEAVALLPVLQMFMMEAWTSCTRLEKYLNQPDKPKVETPGPTISLHKATVAWPKLPDPDAKTVEPEESRSMLTDISLEFPSGELSIITGKTGSGKSLLLAAILGEVKLLSGAITFPDAPPLPEGELEDIPPSEWIIPSLSSFVSQTPWIEGGTVKENIVFGSPFNQLRYQQVLHACALEKDIEQLVDSDETEVGPKGVTLSGGQRWRVALARVLYSRAGIIVLDDVLSAVDAHVGRRIVDEALTGPLARDRTRILATHHAELCLPHAGLLVRLQDGKLESVENLQPVEEMDLRRSEAEDTLPMANGNKRASADDESPTGTSKHNGKASREDTEEKREVGRVKWRVYKAYLKASGGILFWALGIAVLIAAHLAWVAETWSLKELSEASSTGNTTLTAFVYYPDQLYVSPNLVRTATAPERSIAFWMGAYVGLNFLGTFISIARTFTFFIIGLTAAKVFFERMTHAILRAPLRWIDTVPAGRILNRFTADTFTVDRRTVEPLSAFLRSIIALVVVIAASVSVSVYVIFFGLVLLILYTYVASRYIAAAREVKRINSVCHSPIYDQFSSVLSGLSTIRAFHRTQFYMDRMFGLIDDATKGSWALSICSRWMSFRMGMLGAVFVTVVASAVALGRADAALAGFSLTFAFGYTGALSSLLSAMTSMELGFNAAERILEYAEIETEPEGGKDAPAAWPTEGRLEIVNLTAAYAKDLPDVLKNLSFTVNPGERVGIVGRTGAGKSTLAAMLFRLLEPKEGSVLIDNVDISTLKLSQLRRRLAIIPQDPFLFSGTLRSNLDMEGVLDDYDLQMALQRAHLVKPPTVDPTRPSQYPPIEQPPVEQPPVEQPPVEQPPVEQPPVEQPPVEQPPVEPPVQQQDSSLATLTGVTSPTAVASQASEMITQVETTPLLSTSDPSSNAESSNPESGPDPGPTATAAPSDDTNTFSNLSMPISTGGANLSQGQRQLVCLARALLSRPKIVVLDEATSAVDRGTDALIQASLRREFAAAGCTVLVVAHRLSTVADFDRVLVLKEGRVAEIGSPADLLRGGMEGDERQRRRKEKRRELPEEFGLAGAAEEGATGANVVEEQQNETESEIDGVGAFWELVQKSAEKEKLIEMILAKKDEFTDS